jgi:hypothetical protein
LQAPDAAPITTVETPRWLFRLVMLPWMYRSLKQAAVGSEAHRAPVRRVGLPGRRRAECEAPIPKLGIVLET